MSITVMSVAQANILYPPRTRKSAQGQKPKNTEKAPETRILARK